MNRYWIFDESPTPQRFDLGKLLRVIISVVPAIATVDFRIVRARGYGEKINLLDDLLQHVDYVALNLKSIEPLLLGLDEWFYDLLVETSDGKVCFGLHDSTAMFVGMPDDLCSRVLSNFDSVSLIL